MSSLAQGVRVEPVAGAVVTGGDRCDRAALCCLDNDEDRHE